MQEGFLQNPPPQKPFFKTALGITILFILIIFALTLLTFGGFFGYYLWVQKYAPVEKQKELSEKFNPSFSKAPGFRQTGIETNKNIQEFVRSHNPILGSDTAQITILAFIDFECPYCQKSYPIFEQMLKKYEPAVKIVFKHFPIEALHPNAVVASIGATCAHEQEKFWPYYHRVLTEKNMTLSKIISLGEILKLDTKKYTSCIENETWNNQVLSDIQDGIALGVQGTPTYFINQQKIEGVIDINAWDTILLQEIQKK